MGREIRDGIDEKSIDFSYDFEDEDLDNNL
jgi:hypothetical protein